MNFKINIFILLALTSPAVLSSSTKALSVCTLELAGNMVTADRRGFLIDLLNNTLGKHRPLKVELFPPVRAFHSFAKQECDVLVSATEGFITKYTSRETIELPIGLHDYHTVLSHSAEALERLDLKKPQNFVSLHKWFIPQNFKEKHSVYFAHSLENALKMLKAKRVDYFIGFNFLTREYVKQNAIKGLIYSRSIFLDPRKVVFLIHKNKGASVIKKAFKKHMLEYLKTGGYDRDLKKHQVPSYVLMERIKFKNLLIKF